MVGVYFVVASTDAGCQRVNTRQSISLKIKTTEEHKQNEKCPNFNIFVERIDRDRAKKNCLEQTSSRDVYFSILFHSFTILQYSLTG